MSYMAQPDECVDKKGNEKFLKDSGYQQSNADSCIYTKSVPLHEVSSLQRKALQLDGNNTLY